MFVVRYMLLILSLCLFSINTVNAGVYWLPDYSSDLGGRKSNREHPKPQPNRERGCPNGWITIDEVGDLICQAKGSYPWVGICYGDCVCDTRIYKYTAEDFCDDVKLLCCQSPKSLGDAICTDETGIYSKTCNDPCMNYEDNIINEEWGCKQYYEECPDKCKIPYPDNCHNREDVRIGLDEECEKYWEDCEDKCEIAGECNIDCSDYRLNTIPQYAQYSTCEDCDGMVYYKITKCFDDYTLNAQGTDCEPMEEDEDPCEGLTGLDCGDLGCKQSYAQCSSKCEVCNSDPCTELEDKQCGDLGCKTYYSQCPSKCEVCNSDPCTELEDKQCGDLGCKTYYSQCSTKCKECNSDPCTGLEDKQCGDLGCKTYYSQCSTKCKECNTCTPRDCSGYTLTSESDSNATYESCTPGCGDDTTKYKKTGCKYGENTTPCPEEDTDINDDPCENIERLTCNDGCQDYHLSPCNGYCKNCCDFSKYQLSATDKIEHAVYDSYTCNGTGVTKYKFLKCEDGYEGNARGCIKIDPCIDVEDKNCDVCKISQPFPCQDRCKECCNFGEYTLSASDKIAHAEYDSMNCGDVTKYKFLKCEDGYEGDARECYEDCSKSCVGYSHIDDDPICNDKRAIKEYCECSRDYAKCRCPDGFKWDCNGNGCIPDNLWEKQCSNNNESISDCPSYCADELQTSVSKLTQTPNEKGNYKECSCNGSTYYLLTGCTGGGCKLINGTCINPTTRENCFDRP